jgi:endonuclease/exonuclease/phosphatase family metal-dependent hydrolase
MLRKKNRHISIFTWVLIILNCIAVLCLILSYVAFYISPAQAWYLAFFGLAYPFILGVNVIFIFLWLILRKKYIWIPLIPVVAGISHIFSIIEIRSNDIPPASGSLKVISFNVHGHGEYFKNPKGNGNLASVIEFLSAQQPDILCLQEFFLKAPDTLKTLQAISQDLNMEYFFYRNYYNSRIRRNIDALIIFSKYPIVRSGYNTDDHKSTNSVYIDISIDGEIIRVYNVHLESFQFGQDDYTFYSSLKEADTEKTPLKEGTRKIIRKLRRAYEFRARQVDELRKKLRYSPYPQLLCGDLNDTPSSYTYQVMTRGMDDCFKEAGSGLIGNTFRGNLPSFRIDYILIDKKFEAYNYSKLKTDLSDHYPISAYVNIHPAK